MPNKMITNRCAFRILDELLDSSTRKYEIHTTYKCASQGLTDSVTSRAFIRAKKLIILKPIEIKMRHDITDL